MAFVAQGWRLLRKRLAHPFVLGLLLAVVATDAWFAARTRPYEGSTVVGSLLERRTPGPPPGPWTPIPTFDPILAWPAVTAGAGARKLASGAVEIVRLDDRRSFREWLLDAQEQGEISAVVNSHDRRRAWGIWQFWFRTRDIQIELAPLASTEAWTESERGLARFLFVDEILTPLYPTYRFDELRTRDVRYLTVFWLGLLHDLAALTILGLASASAWLNGTALVRSTVLRRRTRIARGLCAACAYDLRGIEGGICPECGAQSKPVA